MRPVLGMIHSGRALETANLSKDLPIHGSYGLCRKRPAVCRRHPAQNGGLALWIEQATTLPLFEQANPDRQRGPFAQEVKDPRIKLVNALTEPLQGLRMILRSHRVWA